MQERKHARHRIQPPKGPASRLVFNHRSAASGSMSDSANRQPSGPIGACLARIDAIDPAAYAKTRNHLEGAVTGLSPWISHGVITLRDLAIRIAAQHALAVQHQLIYELGWRAYFRHVLAHHPEAVFQSLRQGPLPDEAYASELPQDLIEARSGVPAIDAAVRSLYRDGIVHNHARMWLASYWVHIRRVHWQLGASWLLKHLLDGDIASNSLSGQWVAGTSSHKPYLFNADNVARFAPRDWWSPGTSIDRDYASLEAISRGAALPRDRPTGDGVEQPLCLKARDLPAQLMKDYRLTPVADFLQRQLLPLQRLWLVHPWALRSEAPKAQGAQWHMVGFIPTDCDFMDWSLARWHWVLGVMTAICDDIIIGSIRDLSILNQASTSLGTWRNIHLHTYWPSFVEQYDEAPLFPIADRPFPSFSAWWKKLTAGYSSLDDLLDRTEHPTSTREGKRLTRDCRTPG